MKLSTLLKIMTVVFVIVFWPALLATKMIDHNKVGLDYFSKHPKASLTFCVATTLLGWGLVVLTTLAVIDGLK
jgi:hypothetical protein